MKILKKILKEAEGSLELVFDKAFSKINKELEIEDAVTLGFFEDMVRKIDSFTTLAEKEKSSSIDLITRSILESYVYLKLLFLRERRLYARSYMATQKLRELSMYNKITSDNKNGKKIRELLGKGIDDIKKATNFGATEEKLKDLKEQFSDVFERRRENQKWYNLDGKTKNFEQLCIKLDMFAEYELAYRILSNEVHSMDIMKRWHFEKNQVFVLEGYKNNDMNVSIVSKLLLEALNELYNLYGLNKELIRFKTILAINYRLSKN
ncbi:DUF5677 domain-containing protein [Paucisalibacillus sp. EB02]|uniref:DUF5677 domain-containing protein n=1 Tax=Paucisalibacillus sp. EB02 TaxID=1347087 RepID=UPI0004B88A95|nr:DUF5677 domain-containing protein [Paucisalibacillus sp. EB02]